MNRREGACGGGCRRTQSPPCLVARESFRKPQIFTRIPNMQFLIILRGYHPSTCPTQLGEFRWHEPCEAYLWDGRPLHMDEFNTAITGILERNHDLWAHPITVQARQAAQAGEPSEVSDSTQSTSTPEGTSNGSSMRKSAPVTKG